MKLYTKAHLEQIVLAQLENLDAMNDLVSIVKAQNVLLDQANERLKKEIEGFRKKTARYGKEKAKTQL